MLGVIISRKNFILIIVSGTYESIYCRILQALSNISTTSKILVYIGNRDGEIRTGVSYWWLWFGIILFIPSDGLSFLFWNISKHKCGFACHNARIMA